MSAASKSLLEDYGRVLETLRRNDADVRFCVRSGSQVYGTAREGSDQDFLLVLADPNARQDLLWGKNLNVVVHGAGTYAKALEDQSVFALEALFAPEEHRLKEARPPFPYRPHVGRLFDSAKARSDSDWSKAKKKFDEEPEVSKKRALHSLRVLAFAVQVAEVGRIGDFRVALPWWEQMRAADYQTWDAVEENYGRMRNNLLDDLRRRARR